MLLCLEGKKSKRVRETEGQLMEKDQRADSARSNRQLRFLEQVEDGLARVSHGDLRERQRHQDISQNSGQLH